MAGIQLPSWIKPHLFAYQADELSDSLVKPMRNKLRRFHTTHPKASIVIPAYNEESRLLHTLSSLADLTLSCPAELLVVNNNSSDRTQELLDRLEVHSIFEPQQGIRFARQTGLEHVRGEIILQADADSIYPPDWGSRYIEALSDPAVMVVYGSHAFIPSKPIDRIWLSMHEKVSRTWYAMRKGKSEYYNTLGFNMAFRTQDALDKGSYDHDEYGSEDGEMTLHLMQHGKVVFCHTEDCLVWTSDRRLKEAGSLLAAFWKRVSRELGRVRIYRTASEVPD